MKKTPHNPQQRELPLLMDIRERSADNIKTPREIADMATGSTMYSALAASEKDMQVYRQISDNYFRSLQKK